MWAFCTVVAAGIGNPAQVAKDGEDEVRKRPPPHPAQPTTTMSFHPPRKVILTKEQLEAFQASKTHQDIVNYVETLNNAVVGVKLSDQCSESPVREYPGLRRL